MIESFESAWERLFKIERSSVQCPTCDGEGDVLHDIDCDGCARGEDHSETCPRCKGETVVPALIPALDPLGEAHEAEPETEDE